MNKKVRQIIAKELLLVAKDLVGGSDNVFFTRQGNTYTLWVSYAPNSGTVSIFRGGIDGYRTDKSSDSNYDGIVRKLVKNIPANKIVTIPIYDLSFAVSDDAIGGKFDIYGGSFKPSKKAYAILTKDKDIVVGFFTRAGEAKAWLKHAVVK